jgi:hypothetical protein
MRIKNIVATMLLSCAVSVGQASQRPQQDLYRSSEERTVAMLLADNGQAAIPGFLQTLVNRMGDDAAVGIIQYLGERKMTASEDFTSPQETERILDIIRMAFAVPSTIESDRERIPKASLVLMKYLTCLPASGSLRDDIESTSRFVEELKVRTVKQLNE